MSFFSRPSSDRYIEDEPVSPRTIPQGYNSNWADNSNSSSSRYITAAHSIPSILGKRTHQQEVHSPFAKRPCLGSDRVPQQAPLRHSPLPPQPATPHLQPTIHPHPDPSPLSLQTSLPTSLSNSHSLSRTLAQDQYLRLLPPSTSTNLTTHIFPPPPAQFPFYPPFGNDIPTSTFVVPQQRGVAVHPLLRCISFSSSGTDALDSSAGVVDELSPQDSGKFPMGADFAAVERVYPELWRALQLATRFLTNRQSLELFHRIIFEVPERLEGESEFYGAEMWRFPSLDGVEADDDDCGAGLSEKQRVETTDVLAALAKHITIEFAGSEEDATKWAFTERDDSVSRSVRARLEQTVNGKGKSHSAEGHLLTGKPTGPSVPRSASSPADNHAHEAAYNTFHSQYLTTGRSDAHVSILEGFRGTNARITLNPIFLQYLHRKNTSRVPPHAKLYVLFFLAVTIVHEITHAVWMCRVPPPPAPAPWISVRDIGTNNQDRMQVDTDDDMSQKDNEPFVNEDRKAELGRAWEASVFGGGSIEPLGQFSGKCARTIDEIPPWGQILWGDLFAVGLGCRIWPDTSEKFVKVSKYPFPVPLARLSEELEKEGQAVPMSGARYERLRVLEWQTVRQMFDRQFWEQVDGQVGGLRAVLRRQIEQGVEVQRENADWRCVQGAVAVDDGEWLGEDDEEEDLEDEDEDDVEMSEEDDTGRDPDYQEGLEEEETEDSNDDEEPEVEPVQQTRYVLRATQARRAA